MTRPRWTATTLATAVVAVVAATTFAFLAFTTDDGANTPDAAARAMIEAIRTGDLIGVSEALPPGERRALRTSTVDVVTQLQRLGLVAGSDGSRVQGFQPSVENVTFSTTVLAKDVVAIDLNGGVIAVPLAANATPPLTDSSREMAVRAGFHPDGAASTLRRDFSTDPLRVVAVREGGGWYISLGYSIAEALRSQARAALPELGKGPDAIGSSSPEAAVTDLITAYAGGDPERVLTVLHPDEVRAVYDYGPVFLPAAKAKAKAADDSKSYDVQANRVVVASSGSGPQRTVRVTALDIDARDEIKKTHVTYDGRCLHTDERIGDSDAPYVSVDSCDEDWKPDAAIRETNNPIANLAVFGGGSDLPTFVVIERDDRWFISPVRTVLDSLAETLRNVPPDQVDVLADRLIASWKAGAGDGISGHPIVVRDDEPKGTDEQRRRTRAEAFVAACSHLIDGAQGEALTISCLQHAVDTKRIALEDLPAAAQAPLHAA